MDGKTEIAKDALPIGGQLSSEELNPSNPLEKVYKESEVNDLINQRHSKLDKQIAGLTKELTSADERVKAAEDALKQYQEQIDQSELEAARGDPVKLRELQAKKSYKDRIAELDGKKKELARREQDLTHKEAEQAEKVRAAEEVTLGMKLYEIAAKYELNPEDLKKDIKDLNLTTEQQVENLAKRLSSTGERLPGGEEEGRKTTPISVPTFGRTVGTPTAEQLDKMTPEEYAAWRKKAK